MHKKIRKRERKFFIKRNLEESGITAAAIHGNKSQGQRDRAISNFRDGSVKILVATDVAARGIDVPGIEQVFNYDLPNVPENYVHRIGRTARAGKKGDAVAFCSAEEMSELRAIEKVLAISIKVVGGKPWSDEAYKKAKSAAKTATKNAAASRTEARRNSRRKEATKTGAGKSGAAGKSAAGKTGAGKSSQSKPSSNNRSGQGKRKRGPKKAAA